MHPSNNVHGRGVSWRLSVKSPKKLSVGIMYAAGICRIEQEMNMRTKVILALLVAGAFGSVSSAWAQSEVAIGSGRYSAIETCMIQAREQAPDQGAKKQREAIYRGCMKKLGRRP